MNTPEINGLYLSGIPFHLVTDENLILAQLHGLSPDIPHNGLRTGINTDIIIPAIACKNPDATHLGDHVMTGWENGLIGPGDVTALSPQLWIAGMNFGSGSSREHAPVSMRSAGCCAVVAESFSPIMERNLTNTGILTTTNQEVVSLHEAGQPIPLEFFLEGKDPLSRDILLAGGLLPYLKLKTQGRTPEHPITTTHRPMTITEKWLAKFYGVNYVKPGDSGFGTPDNSYSYEYTLPLSAQLFTDYFGSEAQVARPDVLTLFNDHLSLDSDPQSFALQQTTRDFALNHKISLYDIPGFPNSESLPGICHTVMLRKVMPGVIFGTDSHTTMLGVLGPAFGIGATDFAGIAATGEVMLTVPQSVKVTLKGALPPGTSIRDTVMALTVKDATEGIIAGRVMEVHLDATSKITFTDLTTIANMAAELRANSIVFAPNHQTADFLVRTGRSESVAEALALFPIPDNDAEYAAEINIDLAETEPLVAVFPRHDAVVPLSELPEIQVTHAIIGSCLGGTARDIGLLANILKNRQVYEGVRLSVQPSSVWELKIAEREGWLEIIRSAGGNVITDMGCGACVGVGPAALHAHSVAVTNNTRNYDGRMGTKGAEVYLADTAIVAVSAILGRIPSTKELKEYLAIV